MTNPYDILGISSDADKGEIDAAYNRLITEYQNSAGSDDVSEEIYSYKIQELTTAYNQAVSQCCDKTVLGSTLSENINPYYAPVNSVKLSAQNNKSEKNVQPDNSAPQSGPEAQNTEKSDNDPNDIFGSANRLTELGRYAEAENLLNSISYKDTAEWHFCYGKMCRARGWMNQASEHFYRATVLEPSNEKYRQAYADITEMKAGSSKISPAAMAIAGGALCIGAAGACTLCGAFSVCVGTCAL